ncbi:MAG: hypothetical protein CME64_13420 [Halobacteriovoraceae bacterium]|nr:hypothetical protein [Halobacteriovoraceae bacterium]|tara:strand:- start:10094 stop:10495 length:402 start_codon:yes stop_codon:yes gene_type:complete
MKKLFISLLVTCTISSSLAGDFREYAVTSGAVSPIVITTFHPVAGVVSAYSVLYTAIFAIQSYNYEGLSNDSIEVLAGSIELEDSAALTMLKEDILENKVAIEAELQANDIDLTVEELTDEEIAQLALASSIQ